MIRLFLLLFLASCGKYGNPVPPSALAPKAPSEVKAILSQEGTLITWNLPRFDRRGKRLTELETIRLYRRKMPSVLGELAGTEKEGEWELISEKLITDFVPKKDNKDPLGKVAIKGSQSKSGGEFLDNNIKIGETYQYYVVATNQGGQIGSPSQILQVTLRGEGEVITLPNREKL